MAENERKLTDYTCTDFTGMLASKQPVPGGGGAAALAGALASSLCLMVGNYTVGKKKYAKYEEDVRHIMEKAEKLRTRLLGLIDEDADAFEPLSRAYGIPKTDPSREDVLEKATLNACRAPLEMVRCCSEVIDLLREMLVKGSVMLVSDIGCGASLGRAAMESAAMNVFINTSALQNRKQADKLETEVNNLLRDSLQKADVIVETVNRRIRREEE
jgi:formiminotetrahydrofolate cyclodeaminase